MQLQYSHMAASSSPMYGGGLRWGTNDLALKMLKWSTLAPIPAFPREAGEGDAATCRLNTRILQHLPPPCMGEDRGGGQTTSHLRC